MLKRAAVVVMCLLLASANVAAAAGPSEPTKLHPVDGGHWQGGAGLPDRRGLAAQGLVGDVAWGDPHRESATITGWGGAPTSELESLGFAVTGSAAGIIPCIKVTYVAGDGSVREAMFMEPRRAAPDEVAGWTVHQFDVALPEGTISGIDLGVHIDAMDPTNARLLFDNVTVNTSVWTSAADNGAR